MPLLRNNSLTRGQLTRHFDARETLDLVAYLHVVVVLDADTALGAGTNFIDVILEATQRLQSAFEDHHVVAQDADRIVATDVPVRHDATRDRAELAGAEHFAHFGKTDDRFLHFRRQHAGQQRAHLVDRFVDDAVVADVDAFFLDHRASRTVGAYVEADDPRLRCRRQGDVGLGDTANATADH